jgi:hypothetical protein
MVKQVRIGSGVALLGMVAGLVVGANYGGNYATNFEFRRTRVIDSPADSCTLSASSRQEAAPWN